MPPLVIGLGWALAGALAGWLHMLMLRRALGSPAAMEHAMRRVALQLPLRLLVMAPFVVGAALSGLAGCLGLIAGLMAGRVTAVLYYERLARHGDGRSTDAGLG